MALIAKPFTFSAGAVIIASQHNSNFDTIYNDYNGNIDNNNISGSAAIADTKLAPISSTGKVNISALTVASQATGDLIYASSGSAWARLGVGSNGQTLQLVGGLPAWAAVALPATQAEMEAASSTTVSVTPGRTQYHPGVSKAWCSFNGTGTPAMLASYNMDSSITDNGTGDWTVSLATDMSSGNYCTVGMCKAPADSNVFSVFIKEGTTPGAGTINVRVSNGSGTFVDSAIVNLAFFGDQA